MRKLLRILGVLFVIAGVIYLLNPFSLNKKTLCRSFDIGFAENVSVVSTKSKSLSLTTCDVYTLSFPPPEDGDISKIIGDIKKSKYKYSVHSMAAGGGSGLDVPGIPDIGIGKDNPEDIYVVFYNDGRTCLSVCLNIKRGTGYAVFFVG